MLSIGLGLLVLMVTLGISKAFEGVYHARLVQKLTSCRIAGLSFLSNRRLQVILDGKSSQKYPVNAGVPQCSIVGTTIFLLSLMTFLMMSSITLLSMLIMLLITLSVIRHLICDKN